MLSDKEYIKNLIIASAFIAFGLFMPDITEFGHEAFSANIAGISMGIGIGWIMKSIFEHRAKAQES